MDEKGMTELQFSLTLTLTIFGNSRKQQKTSGNRQQETWKTCIFYYMKCSPSHSINPIWCKRSTGERGDF